MAKTKAIIVDLDGTLANIEHRRCHIEGTKKNWKAFFSEISEDLPHAWCQYLVANMANTHSIIYLTGRGYEYEKETRNWLDENSPVTGWFLFMRPKDNFEKDCVIKERVYKEHIEPNFEVSFCVDDRNQVVDMWRSLELVCLQCYEGDF